MIRLTPAQERGIRDHGARDFPHECCGVILGDARGDQKIARELRPLSNVHEEGHERRYLISPEEMRDLQLEEFRTKRKILGFYHSHPDHPAIPSEYDRDWAWPWWSYIIVSVRHGEPKEMTAWRLNEARDAFEAEEMTIAEREDSATL